jgi:hypothetical protein
MTTVTVHRSAPPATPSAFRKAAEAAFHRSNPDAAADGARLVWLDPPRRIVFPTGKAGFIGTLRVKAPGYSLRTFHVTLCGTSLTGI